MKNTLLKPKIDAVFKAVFGSELSKDILESFLRCILNISDNIAMDIFVIDPVTKAEKEDDKTSILDLRLETSHEIINIEIQLNPDIDMIDRIIYGLSKSVTNQKFKGDTYKLKKVVSIVITDYFLIKEHEVYHDTFHYYSKITGHTFSRSTEIHTLELPKLPETNDGTSLWNWLKFIKSEETEEFEMLAEKDEKIGKAVSILKDISQDEAMQIMAYRREMTRWKEQGERAAVYEEGREEGREEGILQGQILLLHDMGYTKQEISKRLNISIEAVDKNLIMND